MSGNTRHRDGRRTVIRRAADDASLSTAAGGDTIGAIISAASSQGGAARRMHTRFIRMPHLKPPADNETNDAFRRRE